MLQTRKAHALRADYVVTHRALYYLTVLEIFHLLDSACASVCYVYIRVIV